MRTAFLSKERLYGDLGSRLLALRLTTRAEAISMTRPFEIYPGFEKIFRRCAQAAKDDRIEKPRSALRLGRCPDAFLRSRPFRETTHSVNPRRASKSAEHPIPALQDPALDLSLWIIGIDLLVDRRDRCAETIPSGLEYQGQAPDRKPDDVALWSLVIGNTRRSPPGDALRIPLEGPEILSIAFSPFGRWPEKKQTCHRLVICSTIARQASSFDSALALADAWP